MILPFTEERGGDGVSVRAWRSRHVRSDGEDGPGALRSKLGWTFAGYLVSVLAVSAIAYFADDEQGAAYAWILLAGSIPVAALVWLLARHYFPHEFHSAAPGGVGVVQIDRRFLVRSAMAGVALGLGAATLSSFFPPDGSMDDSSVTLMLTNGEALKTFWLLSAITVAPLTEEMLFRGVLLGGLRQRLGFLVSVCVSTAAFVAIHLPQLNGYSIAIASISLLGLSAAVARHLSGSLWAAIALHASYNLTLAISGLLLD